MGACLSKKKGCSTSSPVAATKSASTPPLQVPAELKNPVNGGVTVSKPKVETEPGVNLKKEKKKTVQEKQESVQDDEGQVKKEIFIIKHRKSHDDSRERNSSKYPPGTGTAAQQSVPQLADDGLASATATSEEAELMGNKIVPAAANVVVGVGVRTSSCTKEEVDAILIQCGRLSRSPSSKTAAAAAAASEKRGRRFSGSKRSYDFDHCDNDNTISTDEDQKRANATDNSDLFEYDGVAGEKRHQHRQRHRQSPRPSSQGRRRTPSREREQQHQRSSSRERRVSRSPGRRSSETTTSANATTTANASNNGNTTSSRPAKMVSVPATVSSLVMDKSNNGGGGGESATTTGIKRITVKRSVGDSSRGAASPRSQSPARANGNAANQQQPSLSRNSSRKAEQSPCRRNPLNEIDANSLAYPQSTANNNSSRVQNRPKKDIETEANKKPNVDMNDNSRNRTSSRVSLEKGGVSVNCKTKEQQEEEVKAQHSSLTDNIVVKTVVPSVVDNLKPQTLTRSRSSRRSRDLTDLNPEALLVPAQTYTSLLLEDIQNFHQKNTTSVSLPACVTKACSILEAVADLNSTTGSNFSEDKRNPTTYQSTRNEYNVPKGTNHHYGKRVPDAKDPFVESEVVVSDDVMEPSLHKYVTVNRDGSLGVSGVDMEDQESSGSNSFTVSSGQQHWNISYSSREPNSADSKDCWTSRLNSREEGQKSPLGLEGGRVSSEAGRDTGGARKKLNSKRRECDRQHGSGNSIGRGRLGANKGFHTITVVTAAAST